MTWSPYPKYRDSGVDWLGEVPESWKVSKLRHLCAVTTGDKDTINRVDDGEYPFFIRSEEVQRINSWSLDCEAVLTPGDGAVGKIFHHYIGKFDFHQRVYAFYNFRLTVGRFFFYYLSALFAAVALDGSAKTTVDSLRMPLIKSFQFTFPPDEEDQERIADFLDRETAKIDALIAKQEQLIATLREDRAAAIDGSFNSEDGVAPLKSVLRFAQTGPFGTQLSAEEYVLNGIPVINPSHIVGNAIEPDPAVSVAEEKANALARHRFQIGDIVLGRKGEVDKSALVTADGVGFVCGSDSMLLRPRQGTIRPAYLWWFFQSPRAHGQLEQWSVGSTVSGLNQTTMRKIRLPVPPLWRQDELMHRLIAQARKIDCLVAKATTVIDTLHEYRSALITDAVTGKIDVRGAA